MQKNFGRRKEERKKVEERRYLGLKLMK